MINFKDWLMSQESTAFTRRRDAAAKGLAPPIADYMSRSTPDPWTKKQNEKAFKSTHKKGKKKKKDDSDDDFDDLDDDEDFWDSGPPGKTYHKPSGLRNG